MSLASIIIPCFNDGEYLPDTLKSALAQTYTNIEIIIIDDGSTDPATIELIDAIDNDKIKKYKTGNNGPAHARNYGIGKAAGEYILPLDSDDIIDPTYIEKAIAILENNPGIGVVYCKANLFGLENRIWELPPYSNEEMLVDNIVFVTSVFRKRDWSEVDGFSEIYKEGFEDYDFWLKFIEKGKQIYQIPEILFFYRIREYSRTQNLVQRKSLYKYYDMLTDQHSKMYQEHCLSIIKRLRRDLIEQKIYGAKTTQSTSINDFSTKVLIKEILKRKTPIFLKAKSYFDKIRDFLKRLIKKVKFNSLKLMDIILRKSSKEILQPYCAEKIDRKKYNNKNSDIKIIAFYLPQFHRTKENDEWWGKGFTEWTNVKMARPIFKGHFQPKYPSDEIGYYDLSDIENIEKQAKIMHDYNIDGLAIYYYNFSGTKVLTKPLDIIYNNRNIDIKYCLFWANENWTSIWNGDETKILLENNYDKSTAKELIEDIEKYTQDERYIKINNRAVLIIYKIFLIPDKEDFISQLKQTYRRKTGKELYIIGCTHEYMVEHIYNYDENSLGIDALVEFGQLYMYQNYTVIKKKHKEYYLWDYRRQVFSATGNYEKIKDRVIYPTVYAGFDNSPRRPKGGAYITIFFSIQRFYYWLLEAIRYVRKNCDQKLVFIHSWNEWAEGTAIEPTKKYGYSLLDTIARAKAGIPLYDCIEYSRIESTKCRNLIVIFHCFYMELSEKYISALKNIPQMFDLIITTDEETKKKNILEIIDRYNGSNIKSVDIVVTPNRGRDMAPFLIELKKVYRNYDIGLHIHTKKSLHNDKLSGWGDDMLEKILGNPEKVKGIIDTVSQKKIGIVMPIEYDNILPYIEIGDNYKHLKELKKKLHIKYDLVSGDRINFPAGSMLWFNIDALSDILKLDLKYSDFEIENGQTDGTLSHALERAIGISVEYKGYKIARVS